jgi:hypothetical protein
MKIILDVYRIFKLLNKNMQVCLTSSEVIKNKPTYLYFYLEEISLIESFIISLG